ncbi:MAG TPA: amidohydrolase family protein [Stellaceae bacterium]|nr:amidohydrolase family protein [Stellaceae bacterium]
MGLLLSDEELARLIPADEAAFPSPVPTQIVSNGEYVPLPQTRQQRQVEERIKEIAETQSRRLGIDRRQFLRSASGMAAAFLAMNEVFGPLFRVTEAEAAEPDVAAQRAKELSKQFIFDVQTHFVRDDFKGEGLLDLAKYAAEHWDPGIAKSAPMTLMRYKFNNYVKEVYVDSDTKIALLSGAPFDDKAWWFLSNDQMADARRMVNGIAKSNRMLAHSVITPKQDGWMAEVDRCIDVVKPDSWKGYTIGDPLNPKTTKYPWRLDDEKLMYPFYEKIAKAGSPIICIHKGLMPADYEKSAPESWIYATVDDVPKAAKDWPQISFVIYHSALRQFLESPDADLAEFEKSGSIKWASDLAAIPAKYGVSNVYADIGTSFANSAVTNPRFCAAFMGTLIKGLGYDHVFWGSDSVWYGSPQWQIEALRRLEIPEDMQKKYSFAALGPADGAVKSAIFGYNAARFYKLDLHAELPLIEQDRFSQIRYAALDQPSTRSNAAYGYIARRG